MTSPLDSLDLAEQKRSVELAEQHLPALQIIAQVKEEFREEYIKIVMDAFEKVPPKQ